ncbi:MAG: DNA replication protein [Pseudomonadota bacterium]
MTVGPGDADDLFPQTLFAEPEQLRLRLPVDDRMRAEDFLVAPCNAMAHAQVGAWPGEGDPVLVLSGAVGSGKTHLARIAAARTGAAWLAATASDTEDPAGWIAAPAWVVDDAERFGDEVFLFHLVNLARAERRGLLLTSSFPVALWRPQLADLRSRLLAAPAVAIGSVDDALLGAVLVKQFADRQLRVPPEVIHYLVPRMERSFAAARRVVALIDAAALKTRRPITPGLARDALDHLRGQAA